MWAACNTCAKVEEGAEGAYEEEMMACGQHAMRTWAACRVRTWAACNTCAKVEEGAEGAEGGVASSHSVVKGMLPLAAGRARVGAALEQREHLQHTQQHTQQHKQCTH